ncbi:hypothetical protein [Arthrobacter sp. Y-9]|uniref:hypothetical protein n=1 Tax=Arthrobacter sp. Y-9 TaxID=3039385 RepID=UPI00241DA362|nr:hypothetical protein [Arthrobacter sp. Y-9]WFR82682.1 hypothetical protein P9849_08815 [Arthrobacter sp. Y-9]
MDSFWEHIPAYWWLIFPLSAVAGGWWHRFSKAGEVRHRRRMELERLRAGLPPEPSGGGEPQAAESGTPEPGIEDGKAAPSPVQDVSRLLADHDAVNARWLEYELDVAKMIDVPGMSDVREPLTVEYLKAKRRADSLRPVGQEELSREDLDAYRDAVLAYGHAFDVAERNAHRVKDAAFSPEERERLSRARQLLNIAVDPGSTAPERQAAYRRVRKELDGLLAVPQTAFSALERQIAAALDPSRQRAAEERQG